MSRAFFVDRARRGLAVLVALGLAGCAGSLTVGTRGQLHPVQAIAAATPCLHDVPRRTMLESLEEPDPVKGVDEDGNPITGIRLVVTAESAVKFFEYVEELEALAKRARECVRP